MYLPEHTCNNVPLIYLCYCPAYHISFIGRLVGSIWSVGVFMGSYIA